MKVKFNRTVKHDGVLYEAGHTYEFEGEITPDLEALLDLTHVDVFTQKREQEVEQRVEVKVAEKAPEDIKAEPQPAPMPKTPSMNPVPNVQG